jgi:hypothetical protein
MRLFIVIPLNVGWIASEALTPARTLATQETKFSASSTKKDASQCAPPILVKAAVAASHNAAHLPARGVGQGNSYQCFIVLVVQVNFINSGCIETQSISSSKSSCNNTPTKASRAAGTLLSANQKTQAGNQSKPLSSDVHQVVADGAVSIWPLAG